MDYYNLSKVADAAPKTVVREFNGTPLVTEKYTKPEEAQEYIDTYKETENPMVLVSKTEREYLVTPWSGLKKGTIYMMDVDSDDSYVKDESDYHFWFMNE